MKEILTFVTEHPWWTTIWLAMICQAAIYMAAALKSGKGNDL